MSFNNAYKETVMKYYLGIKDDPEITRPHISSEIAAAFASIELADFIPLSSLEVSSSEALAHLSTGRGTKELITQLHAYDTSFEGQLMIVLLYLYYAVVFAGEQGEINSKDIQKLRVFITCLTVPSDQLTSVEFAVIH